MMFQQKGIAQRVFIQSFDVRSLQYLHQKHPQIKTVLLVENEDSLSKNLKTLGYLPHTYSPYYPLVTPQMVKYLHKKGVKIVPWTVNEPTDMQKLIALNIDGLISDYPNRYFDPNQSISFFEYEGKMEKTIKNDNPNNENQLLQNISIEIVKNNNASKRKNDYVLHLPKEFLTKFATFDVQWIDYYR